MWVSKNFTMPKSYRQGKLNWGRYRPYVNAGIQVGRSMLQGYKMYRDMSTQTRNSTPYNGVVTTAQQDAHQQYKHKRMPRRKRRRWVKFAKKVQYVQRGDLAMQTYVFNGTCRDATSDASPQGFVESHLYGQEGGGAGGRAQGTGDLQNLIGLYPDGVKRRFYFDHAVHDLTFCNTSVATNGFTPALEIDVYDVVYRDGTSSQSLYELLESTAIKGTIDTIGSTLPDINQRGTTLFDFSAVSSVVRMKILKKTKVFLGAGLSATYQVRDNKSRRFAANDLVDEAGGFIKAGYTRSVIFLFKAVVNESGPLQSQVNIGSLKVGTTRTYYYKFEEKSQVGAGYG